MLLACVLGGDGSGFRIDEGSAGCDGDRFLRYRAHLQCDINAPHLPRCEDDFVDGRRLEAASFERQSISSRLDIGEFIVPWPSEVLCRSRTPVAGSRRTILASGTTAPDGSVTVPRKAEVGLPK